MVLTATEAGLSRIEKFQPLIYFDRNSYSNKKIEIAIRKSFYSLIAGSSKFSIDLKVIFEDSVEKIAKLAFIEYIFVTQSTAKLRCSFPSKLHIGLTKHCWW